MFQVGLSIIHLHSFPLSLTQTEYALLAVNPYPVVPNAELLGVEQYHQIPFFLR